MKIKVDHVTNSSSEVFAVVVQDSLVVGSLVAGMTALFNAHRLQFSHSDLTCPQMEDMNQASAEYAKLLTQAMIEEANSQKSMINAAFDQTLPMIEATQDRLRQELKVVEGLIDKLKTSPPSSTATSPQSDPQVLYQHASEYRTYLSTQLQQSSALSDVIREKQSAINQTLSAPENAIDASKRAWLDLQHEKKLLQAVTDGHGPLGYDSAPTLERIQELQAKDDELFKLIAKNDTLTTWANRPFPAKIISDQAKTLQAQLIARKESYAKAHKAKGLSASQKAELKVQYETDIAQLQHEIQRQNRYDLATHAVDSVTYGADTLVDLMSMVEVPFGGLFKTAYLAAKAMATQSKAGLQDRRHAGQYLAKGLIAAASEVVKGTIGVNQPQLIQATTVLTSGLQGGLEASIQGQAVGDAVGKALTKSLIDTTVSNQLTQLTTTLPDPKDKYLNDEAYTLKDLVSDNPITQSAFSLLYAGASVDTVKATL